MNLLRSPSEYYKALHPKKIEDCIDAPENTLNSLKGEIGLPKVASIIVIAITEVVKFYNIGKNISADQIPMIAEMIIERFGHFKVEDIKLAFRIGMYETEIYDRLDGSILLGWLKDHDAKRDEYCATRAYTDIKSAGSQLKELPAANLKSYDAYWASVEQKAKAGDVDAMILWEDHCNLTKELVKSRKRGFMKFLDGVKK